MGEVYDEMYEESKTVYWEVYEEDTDWKTACIYIITERTKRII